MVLDDEIIGLRSRLDRSRLFPAVNRRDCAAEVTPDCPVLGSARARVRLLDQLAPSRSAPSETSGSGEGHPRT
jgi:hypothetical protein